MFTKLADSRAISTIKKLSFALAALDAVTGADRHKDFDVRGRRFSVDFSAACTTAAVSEDVGHSFLLDRNNPLSCIGGGDDPEDASDDRQGVAAFGDGIATSTVRNPTVAVGSGYFDRSRNADAGKAWIKF